MGSDAHDHIGASLAQVQRPLLPAADAVAPYLARIDAARWYSNRGPLLWELEERLQGHFGIDAHAVMLMASGSAAIEAAILAHAGPAREGKALALMPAFTFVATAQAALRCGYTPYFLDIDPATWMLDPQAVTRHARLDAAGLILPVAAMGRRPHVGAWETVQRRTGCPVVIDAAAAFEQFEGGQGRISDSVPTVLSLHATKSFSTAEGGAILWKNPEAQIRAAQVSNFGLTDARVCAFDGINGKLSEYHAAIGLAQLDCWPARKGRIAALAGAYRDAALQRRLGGAIHASPDIGGAYVLFEAARAAIADGAVARLSGAGIGCRRWYGRGLHHEPVFAACARDGLDHTEDLSARLIGLPAAVDLTSSDIATILDRVAPG